MVNQNALVCIYITNNLYMGDHCPMTVWLQSEVYSICANEVLFRSKIVFFLDQFKYQYVRVGSLAMSVAGWKSIPRPGHSHISRVSQWVHGCSPSLLPHQNNDNRWERSWPEKSRGPGQCNPYRIWYRERSYNEFPCVAVLFLGS